MSEIKNYIIRDCLEANSEFSVYRAIRSYDQLHVMIKFINKLNEQEAYQNLIKEYQFATTANTSAVLFSLGIDLHSRQPLLILEDFPSNTLKKNIALNNLTLIQILGVALQIADALQELHKQNITHYQLTPSNILVSTDLKKVKLMASLVSSFTFNEKHQCISPPLNTDRSFRYIAPEQTGRLNVEVDYRADLFSFGIILYEMFTQVLPFDGKGSKEYFDLLCSFHPIPPHVINSEIPEKLSNLILKLFNIEPDERFYTAEKIKHELTKYLIELKSLNTDSEFSQLYKEINEILITEQLSSDAKQDLNEFEETLQTVSTGGKTLMLMTGNSDLERSGMVYEWQKKIVSHKGYFLFCKFEASKKNTPFYGILGGFRHLIYQLNASNDAHFGQMKVDLPKAIWPFGNLLSILLPEFKRFLSDDKETKVEQATESTVKQALTKFLLYFSAQEIPLVLFYEDIQWMDSPSLKFIQEIQENLQRVLFLASYKVNEVNASLPFSQYLENLSLADNHKKIVTSHTFQLRELENLLSKVFGEGDKLTPLAEVILRKSRGNSFIAIHLIKLLIKERLIQFNPAQKDWVWDLQMINDFSSVKNISDLIFTKFSQLDKFSQSLLKKAAVVGKKFDLVVLSSLQSQTEEKTQTQLLGAIFEDLVQKRAEYDYRTTTNRLKVIEKKIDYYFVSEAVHRLIYSLLSKEEREELHCVVANTLYNLYMQFNRDDYLVDITKHYNSCSRLLKDPKDKEKLISLNNSAGLKLKSSGQYFAAVEFFRTGIEHLPANGWQVYYSLAFSLHENLAICELLLGKQREAEGLFKLVSEKSKTFEEKVRAYIVPISIYGQLNKYNDALRCEGEALKLFNIQFSTHPSKLRLFIAYMKLKWSLMFKSIDELKKIPEATDKKAFLLGSIYNSVFHACFASGHLQLTLLNTVKMMSLFVDYGSTEFSSMGIATYAGMLSSDICEDYEKGYQLGLLTLELGKRYPNSIATPTSAIIFYLFVNRWNQPIRNAISPLRDLAKKAFEDGTDIYGVAALVGIGTFSLVSGVNLNTILQEVKKNSEIVNKYKTPSAVATYLGFKEFCHTLMITNDTTPLLETTPTNDNQDTLIILRTYTWKVARYVIMKDFKYALILSDQLIALNQRFPNTPEWNIFSFYYSIALVEDINTTKDKDKKKMLLQCSKRFQRWALAAPCNFQHKSDLIQAEIAALEGDFKKAELSFDKALKFSKKNELINDEAFISERMANFYQKRDKVQWLNALTNAYQKYLQWGATKKAQNLEVQYPELTLSSVKAIEPSIIKEQKNPLKSTTEA